MAKAIRILSLLVVIQVVAVAVAYWPATGTTGADDGGPFLDVAAEAVSSLELKGPEGSSVQLTKKGEEWRIPALNDLPAGTDQVTRLLEGLREASTGLPVATSGGAAQRFRVAKDDYKRRLVLPLADSDSKRVLFFGDTPGAGEIYARREGENSVYRVGVGTHMMPLEADQWLAKDLLSLDQQTIQSLEVNDLRLERAASAGASDGSREDNGADRKWTVSGTKDAGQANPKAVADLVSRIAALRISGAAGDRSIPDGEPALTTRIGTGEGAPRQYHFYAGDKGEDALLVTEQYDTVFTVNTPVFDSIRKAAGREALLAPSASGGQSVDGD
ncbi:DUF4340 domain-containing protein [uncultured Halovibrio sp.]|uniref:DUF4340 domain-containing protein n=1 Tax=uncultured Halovibrio sp. TaxID=985049 RepID=UPI0025D6668A|nr:DUF4340 domain-containing protein [uncultured Halovibrio sp.]